MTQEIITDRIGFLHESDGFWCIACADNAFDTGEVTGRLSPVFVENIRPYSQVCHKCGKLVVDGAKKSADGTPLCLFDPPEKQPDEMTQAEIDRQDYVDNVIYNLVNDLVPEQFRTRDPQCPSLPWDISWIAEVREKIENVLLEKLVGSKREDEFLMAFYPYRDIKFGIGDPSDELFEPTDDPAWEDKR